MKTLSVTFLFLVLAGHCFAQDSRTAEPASGSFKPAEPTSRMWSPEELGRRKAEHARAQEQKKIEALEAQTSLSKPAGLWTKEELERRKAAQQQLIEDQKKVNAEALEILKVQPYPGGVYYFPFVGHDFTRVLGNFMAQNQSEYEISGIAPVTALKTVKFTDGMREPVSFQHDAIVGYTVALRLKQYPATAQMTAAK